VRTVSQSESESESGVGHPAAVVIIVTWSREGIWWVAITCSRAIPGYRCLFAFRGWVGQFVPDVDDGQLKIRNYCEGQFVTDFLSVETKC
jgi:hypothetical protein